MTDRKKQLCEWLQHTAKLPPFEIHPASADASFRRYFRLSFAGKSLIAMDAPPDKEDSRPFVQIAQLFTDIGLQVPQIIQADLAQGWLLLSDLGTQPYLPALTLQTVDTLYEDALAALLILQRDGPRDAQTLPSYDHALLMREMELFRHWFLKKELGLTLTPPQETLLDQCFQQLSQQALAQPQVCVHRDYHSRNLMVTAQNNPGILDFQDAVVGPFCYDLVSLLRDCYIAWPREKVEHWALAYLSQATQAGISEGISEGRFLRYFDWMGVQRHLKATGIFARLHHRDGKSSYLADIPRTLEYVREVTGRYAALRPLHDFLDALVLPRLAALAHLA